MMAAWSAADTHERWVEVISTAPAKLFGMYPRKGSVSVGADADLVIYDPNRRRTISAKTHHMDVDYSCYEGREVQGASDVVLSARFGHHQKWRVHRQEGHGRFIKRSTADFVRFMTLGTRRSLRIQAELGHVADVREPFESGRRARRAGRAWPTWSRRSTRRPRT